ncbi:MAG TPA: cysteine hydrolase [Candidatus Angelobacter sp.]|nr:cysteine hydrolase [Candidatus Angelobacter sp.]
MKPALIVIDMLSDYLDKWPPTGRDRLVQATNELVALMRSHKHPVVWVRQEFEPDLSDAFLEMRSKNIRITIRGTRGAQIVSELAWMPGDTHIIKKRYSAFFETNLDAVLAKLKPDTLVVAGINTHACIRMAAIDAYQRDWPVVLAADCVDSYDPKHHSVSIRYMKDKIARVMTNQEIRAALESG